LRIGAATHAWATRSTQERRAVPKAAKP